MRARPLVHHVITRLIAGGAQENTILACQALRERYDLLLIAGPPGEREGSLVEDARRRGLRVELVEDLVRPISPLHDERAFRALRGIFEAERPDLVHTHSSKAGILGRFAAWSAGVPVVVHGNHGLPFMQGGMAARALYWLLEQAAAQVTDGIVCVGEDMRRATLRHRLARPERTWIVRSGIETERFLGAASCRSAHGIPEEAPVVGMVARMAPHKGHLALVEAAPAGTTLLFVGDGEERERIEAATARKGMRAIFAGHVPPEAVPDLIASMDVVAHPSAWEGLPRVVVQALLVGRPVVALDGHGIREVLEDGISGRIVAPGTLGAALSELLSKPDRGRSMGLAGRARVLDRFDRRRCGEDLDRVYRTILKESLPEAR